MPIKLGEIKLWGLFNGGCHGLYNASRVDQNTVVFGIGDSTYRIELSEKADEHTALIGFDGFLLRHGLVRGTKVLGYRYGRANSRRDGFDGFFHVGSERIEMKTEPSSVRGASEYESGNSKKDWDHLLASSTTHPKEQAYARREKSQRHFLAIPKGKEGSRSLVCHLKPRSLERRYVMIVASYNEVQFITCNSY